MIDGSARGQLATRWRPHIGGLVLVLLLAWLLPAQEQAAPPADAKQPDAVAEAAPEADANKPLDIADKPQSKSVLIRLEGMIGPKLDWFLSRRLEDALKSGAETLILEIDSPGGRLDTTFELIDRLRNVRGLRTVAYIRNEAISGAALTALACDQVVMHPAARLGDCGPIFLDERFMFRHAPEKIRSDLAVKVRDLAVAKQRSPALLEAMVDMSLVVFEVTDAQTGERRYMTDAEMQSSGEPERFQKGPPVFESRVGSFLTLTGERAKNLGLADAVVNSPEELWKQLSVRPPQPVWHITWVDTAAYITSWTSVSVLLIIIGLVAIYLECCTPGIGAGAGIATVAFAIFFWGRFLGGTSTWLEVLLFVLGVFLLGLELFVIPGFGFSGVAGLLLIASSLVMAGQDFLVPRSAAQWRRFGDSLATVALSGVGGLCAVALLSRYGKSLAVIRGMSFAPPPAPEEFSDGMPAAPGRKPKDKQAGVATPVIQVGEWGHAQTPLCPAGKARFGKELVDVVADGDFIERGEPIRILAIHGSRVVVARVE